MEILDTLRPQIKADFLEFYSGADLEAWLSEFRYGEILDLIIQLPDPKSRFYTALNKPENEDLYKLINGDPAAELEAGEDQTDSAPAKAPYQHAGLTEILLMDILDSMNRHRSEAMVKGSKKQPKKIKEYPRPESARQRIITKASDEQLDSLADDLGYLEDL